MGCVAEITIFCLSARWRVLPFRHRSVRRPIALLALCAIIIAIIYVSPAQQAVTMHELGTDLDEAVFVADTIAQLKADGKIERYNEACVYPPCHFRFTLWYCWV